MLCCVLYEWHALFIFQLSDIAIDSLLIHVVVTLSRQADHVMSNVLTGLQSVSVPSNSHAIWM